MAKWTMHGMDEYVSYLQKIGKNTSEIIGTGVYAMAEVVADAIRKNIEALPARPDIEGPVAYREKRKARLTTSEKKGLEEGFGISPMEDDDGYLNVKLGFDGYNENGIPNVLMARIFESGTSTIQKHPFVRPAVNRARKRSLQRGQAAIDEKIYAIKEADKV